MACAVHEIGMEWTGENGQAMLMALLVLLAVGTNGTSKKGGGMGVNRVSSHRVPSVESEEGHESTLNSSFKGKVQGLCQNAAAKPADAQKCTCAGKNLVRFVAQ